MKIWVDDIRQPPDNTWTWVKKSQDAIWWLYYWKASGKPIEIMSLDHDLGGSDTTRPIVLWCCENDYWPEEVLVHSANPVGIEWLTGMIARYKV